MADSAVQEAWRWAARQHGVIRRDQAAQLGLTTRQIDYRVLQGFWTALLPGVYRVEGAPDTWHQRLKAASLWAARDFAISHRAAAALHHFPRFPEGCVELSLTRHAGQPQGVVIHQVDSLSPKELTSIHGLCVTNPARTLLDLAADTDEADVRASVDYALTRKLTTLDKLTVAVDRAGRRRGVAFIKALVHEYLGGDGPAESELESLVQETLEAAGVPRAQKQRVVHVGQRLRRVDFLIPGTRVVIEADGYAYHASPKSFEDDRRRHNELTAKGLVVLRWTWTALKEHPETLIVQLLATVRLGGLFS